MWTQIRGKGLSYSYNIYANVNEGLLYLFFYSATSITKSFKEAKDIIVIILN